MVEISTDKSLIEALEKAAKTGVTPEEYRRQELSFVMSMLSEENSMTSEEVQRIIEKQGATRTPA